MPSEQIYLEPIAQIGHDVVLTRGVRSNPCVYSIEKYISKKHSITQKEAGNIIDMFTSSVISSLGPSSHKPSKFPTKCLLSGL